MTRCLSVVRGLVALAVLALAVSCSGDFGLGTRPDETVIEAVPWSRAEEVAAARRGEYREVLVVASGLTAQPLLEEWVAFDLDRSFIDRTIAIHVDRDGMRSGKSPTRESPSLRFIYNASAVYMWTSWAQGRCGAPWVEMPPEQMESDIGMDLDLEPADLLVVEPLDVLGAVDPGEPRSSNEDGSVYDVMVPGAVGVKGVSFWAANPDIASRVAQQEHSAEVRLARDGGRVEIEVDLSDVAAEVMKATGQGSDHNVRMTMHWTVTTSSESVATVPVDVADWASCQADTAG